MPSPGAVAATFAVLVFAAACGKTPKLRSTFAPVGTVGLTATFPSNGSVDVEPDTAIRLVLVSAQESIAPGAITIEQNGVRLAGTIAGVGPTRVWTWRAARELPRGATIDVRVATGIGRTTAASFTVREAGPELTFDLPDVVATSVRAWPSGRRAVLSGGSTYEVSQVGVTQVPVVIPTRSWTYGDDKFAFTEPDAPLNPTELVRRDLSGMEERILLPFPRPIVARNHNGDVVIFVTTDIGTANDWGPWRLRANETQWQWLGSLTLTTTPDIDIDAEGNVVCAFFAGQQLNLQRFVVGSLVPQIYQLPAPDAASETSFDLADDGSGVFAWRDERLRAVKFSPALGLRQIALNQARPLSYFSEPTTTQQGLVEAIATSGGDALVLTNYLVVGFQFVQRGVMMQRIHPNNPGTKAELVEANFAFAQPARSSHVERRRGEVWSLLRAIDGRPGFEVERSAPGGTFRPLRTLYPETLPGNTAGSVVWTMDESGRALFAINELGTPTCRVIIWQ